jgi:hypothetical protein
VGISFRSAVRPNNDNRWSKKLDEMPAGTRDGEQVLVIGYVAKDFKGGVVLKKKIHLNANSPNILEHVRELHIFGIRPKPVETTSPMVSHEKGLFPFRATHMS